MPTVITGKLKVHKSDGVTRQADAVAETPTGSLAVWDDVEPKFIKLEYPDGSPTPLMIDKRSSEIIEPDILVKSDKWERIERDGHHWKRASASALLERAKERDDVDEEKIKDTLG